MGEEPHCFRLESIYTVYSAFVQNSFRISWILKRKKFPSQVLKLYPSEGSCYPCGTCQGPLRKSLTSHSATATEANESALGHALVQSTSLPFTREILPDCLKPLPTYRLPIQTPGKSRLRRKVPIISELSYILCCNDDSLN